MTGFQRALLTLAAATASFVAAWTIVDEAAAHGTHCGGSNPICNINLGEPSRYYAGQTANPFFPAQAYSNGIRGYLSVQDVALRDYSCTNSSNDPKCDFLINVIGSPDIGGDSLEIGFVEGAIPWAPASFSSATPKLYTEYDTACNGHNFIWFSTPAGNQRYNEFVGTHWGGQTLTCGSVTRYRWWYERGTSFAPMFYLSANDSQGQYGAQTEHFDNTHMEPNGLQCFGGAGCTPPTYGYDLSLWNQGGGYFYLWTYPPLPQPLVVDTTHCDPQLELDLQCGSGYTHDEWQLFYSFRTSGWWQ